MANTYRTNEFERPCARPMSAPLRYTNSFFYNTSYNMIADSSDLHNRQGLTDQSNQISYAGCVFLVRYGCPVPRNMNLYCVVIVWFLGVYGLVGVSGGEEDNNAVANERTNVDVNLSLMQSSVFYGVLSESLAVQKAVNEECQRNMLQMLIGVNNKELWAIKGNHYYNNGTDHPKPIYYLKIVIHIM